MFIRSMLVGAVFVMVGFVSACTSSPPADPNTITLSSKQLSQFDQTLTTISEKSKITFVIEGYPLKPLSHLNETNQKPLHLTTEKAIDKIAKTYDYDASRLSPSSNIYVLKKRYTSSYDLPCVTLEEYVLALHDVSRIMKPFLPKPAWTTTREFAQNFNRSLTAKQGTALQNEQLTVGMLTHSQQAQIRRLIANSYVGSPAAEINNALYILEQPQQIFIRREHTETGNPFGYDFQDIFKRTVFRPMSDMTIDIGVPKRERAPLPDPFPLKVEEVTWSGKETLASVVEDVNRGSRGDVPVQVAPELATKPVTLIGASHSSPQDIVKGLAKVYGLRVAKDKVAVYLTRPRIQNATTIADLNKSIRHAMPEPFVRAMATTSPTFFGGRSPRMKDRLTEEELVPLEKYTLIANKAAARLKKTYNIAATSDKTRAAQRISLNDLEPEGRSAFALVVLREHLGNMRSIIGQDAPMTVTDFNKGRFKGGVYERNGKTYYSLVMEVKAKTPNGSTSSNTNGFFDVPWEKL